MEPGGETAGVIGIERITIWRNWRRGKTGIGIEIVEMIFFFADIERIAKGKNKSNGISNDTKSKSPCCEPVLLQSEVRT